MTSRPVDWLGDLLTFMVAGLGLVLLAPLLLVISLCIYAESGRPVFFRQRRVGRREGLFWMYKFRTMLANGDEGKITTNSDPRVTQVGSVLRRYKLDELPQLWNVLRGEMTLVGPRPEVPELWHFFPATWRAAISSLKPGITGLASLVMREESKLFREDRRSIEDRYRREVVPVKMRLELRYLLRRSLLYDFEIVICSLLYAIFPRVSVRRRAFRALSIEDEVAQ